MGPAASHRRGGDGRVGRHLPARAGKHGHHPGLGQLHPLLADLLHRPGLAFDNGAGATLNRVLGNVPSGIDGRLTATGSVYLVNPAGVAVGSTGAVATGGSFVASTHDVTDKDFLNGGPSPSRAVHGRSHQCRQDRIAGRR
ncbi:two-partner secretion domain-containing protein [Xanthobacter sediminis]